MSKDFFLSLHCEKKITVMKKVKNPKQIDYQDEYLRVNKMFARQEELERNGGRWVAKDRPHKNKKKYDRKRDRKIKFDDLFFCYQK